MSLVTRVSAFFLLSLALVLAGFSATLYRLAGAHLERDLDEVLVNTLDALSEAARDDDDEVEWTPGARPPTPALHHAKGRVSWVVFDGRDRLIDHSPGSPADDFLGVPARTPGSGHTHFNLEGREGRRWRVTVRRLLPGAGDRAVIHDEEDETPDLPRTHAPMASSLILATAAPLGPVEASLGRVAGTLVGLSVALWLVTALAGRRLCRRALRPVARMATAAAAMTAADRGQGLPSPGTHDELENLAQSFNGLLGRLHEAMERQQRFAGDASHQLRTPLTALLSEIDLALRRERPADEYRETLRAVRGDADRLRGILEALLFLARADNEAGLPDLQPVELSAWVRDHLAGWSSHPRACDLSADVDAEPPVRVKAHPALLGQLVDNLLDNACKYSPAGSPVVLGLRRAPGGVVELSVGDRGEGLTPDESAHVFEAFYRSPRARLRGRPGVGLGLAVVQRIACAFGGRVAVESEPGMGTRFTAVFPEAAGPSTNGVGPGRAGPAPGVVRTTAGD